MKVLDHVLEGFVGGVSWRFLLCGDVELLDGRLQGLHEVRLSALSLQPRRWSSSRLNHPERACDEDEDQEDHLDCQLQGLWKGKRKEKTKDRPVPSRF